MARTTVSDRITSALFELLIQKDLSQITPTEIITQANVCRSSYYRNFYLPEDIIRKYFSGIFSKFSLLPNSSDGGLKLRMEQVYQILLQEEDCLLILDRRGLLHLMDDALYRHCTEQIRRESSFDSPYQVDFYAGAATFIIRAWIHNGFRESPAEMAQLVNTYLLLSPKNAIM